MDELTLLRYLEHETPGPTAAETAAARARLLDVMAGPQSRAGHPTTRGHRTAAAGRLGRRRFWAPVAAASAVTAIAVTGAVIATSGRPAARPSSVSPPPTAASVLLQAAAAAARQPSRHGRYFVTEFEQIDVGNGPAALVTYSLGAGVPGRFAWLNGFTASSLPEAIYHGLTWAGLQHLAAAPVQLEAALVNAASGAGMPLTQAASEFAVIASLLAMGPASPALRSALYQLAARLPGLVVVLHAHDLLGRSATEVWAPGRVQIYPTALYFNPSTGAVLDLALHRATARCPALREDALLASGYVSSAYRLPPRAVHKPWPLAKLSPSCDILPTPEP